MYFSRTPHIARLLYPGLVWTVNDPGRNIYVTFDDGPDPGVTPEALDLLASYDAKATFFCVGQKVGEHPALYQELLDRGHTTGNHTHDHLNGKTASLANYLSSVEKASGLIRSHLFRPPYGRITRQQVRKLRDRYRIVMWSVLPGDFDPGRPKEAVLSEAVKHTRSGSIVVFHDNVKFRDKMLFALEGFLRHFKNEGYRFRALDPDTLTP